MKNIYNYLIILLFIIPSSAWAEGPARWTVKDSDTTIHLFGTIHSLKPSIKWQSDSLREDFDKSRQIIFELAPNQQSWNVVMAVMKTHGMLQPRDSLKNYLDSETYSLVHKKLLAANIPYDAIERVKPWFAAMLISQVPAIENDTDAMSREFGVEQILSKRAWRNRQNVAGLESMDSQIAVFSKLPMDEQVHYLKSQITNGGVEAEDVDDLIMAWLSGDMEKLDSIVNESLKNSPLLFERLLPLRNKNWVRQIQVIMDYPGDIFIAVGAGHMLGDEGLIKLLKEAGYEVERVN